MNTDRYFVLNNGIHMPKLGLGVYKLPDMKSTEETVRKAIDMGYRLIDTASYYANESGVGAGVRTASVPREEVTVTTKLWFLDTGYEKTKEAFGRSLKALGLDYIDLYLMHQPYGDVHGAWRAMEELYRDGYIRAIGVSNFHADRVYDLMCFNEVVPAVNQREVHVYHQKREEVEWLRAHGVQPEAYSPFGREMNDVLKNPVVGSIAEEHGATPAQVLLKWTIDRGISVIAKSVRVERLKENLGCFDLNLTEANHDALARLECGRSIMTYDHREPGMLDYLIELPELKY